MTNKNLAARLDISQRHLPGPLLSILGPILGLVYIIILPFIGVVTLILLGLIRARESLAAKWRKALRTTVIA